MFAPRLLVSLDLVARAAPAGLATARFRPPSVPSRPQHPLQSDPTDGITQREAAWLLPCGFTLRPWRVRTGLRAAGSAPAAPGPAIYLVSTRDVPGMDLYRPEPRVARRVWEHAGAGPCHDSSGSRTWPVSSSRYVLSGAEFSPAAASRHDRGGRAGGALPSWLARLSLAVLA